MSMNKRQKREKICGIYCFEVIGGNPNKIGAKYPGQSIDVDKRLINHWSELKHKKHDNPRLQRYYNKYGKKSLTAYLLHQCLESELNFWETFWIKSFNSRQDFNDTDGGNKPPKRCTGGKLKNFITGEIVEFNSIVEFAGKYNVSPSAVGATLSGRANHVRSWYNPDNKKNWHPKKYIIISPSGKRYEIIDVFIADFCREHGIKCSKSLHNMLKGKYNQYYGWTRPDSVPDKIYKLIDRNGNLVEFTNVRKFAKDNNINISTLRNLLNGYCEYTYTGWRLYKEGIGVTPFNYEELKKNRRKSNPIIGKYKFISPSGELIKADYLIDLAEEYNLEANRLSHIWAGQEKSYKGWTKYKE